MVGYIENIDYKKYKHCKSHLRYHIIFVTKYRRKCLDQIRDYVFEAFRYVESNSEFRILNMNLDKDHIHLLVTFPAKYGVGQTISRLKQMSTNYLYSKCEKWLRKFYWTKKRLLWTHGYYVSTLGQISENVVWKYIDNQGLDKATVHAQR